MFRFNRGKPFTLLGQLTRHPQMRCLDSGRVVTTFQVETENGQYRVAALGEQAIVCSRQLGKGSVVCIEGVQHKTKKKRRDGSRSYTQTIVASSLIYLGVGTENGKNERF